MARAGSRGTRRRVVAGVARRCGRLGGRAGLEMTARQRDVEAGLPALPSGSSAGAPQQSSARRSARTWWAKRVNRPSISPSVGEVADQAGVAADLQTAGLLQDHVGARRPPGGGTGRHSPGGEHALDEQVSAQRTVTASTSTARSMRIEPVTDSRVP